MVDKLRILRPAIIVSPHLDDAALSCLLTVLNGQIDTIATVFTGMPAKLTELTRWHHLTRTTSPTRRMSERVQEDTEVWRGINQHFKHLHFVEPPSDTISTGDLINTFRAETSSYRTIFAPAGIGFHPDHVVVRDALLAAKGVNQQVIYYGELPYCSFYGWPDRQSKHLDVHKYWSLPFMKINMTLSRKNIRLIELTDEEVSAKIKILKSYKTQYEALSGGSLRLFEVTPYLKYEAYFAFS